MKKLALFFALLSVVFAVSCKKDKEGGQVAPSKVYYSISMSDDFANIQMKVGGDPISVPLSAYSLTLGQAPKPLPVQGNVSVSCEPEGVVECVVTEEGMSISPLQMGNATVTAYVTAYPEAKVECSVAVGDTDPVPASVAITKTDSHFHSDGGLYLTEGESITLSAAIISDKGSAMSGYQLNWSVVSGASNISLTAAGKVTTKDSYSEDAPTAKVKVAIVGHETITDELTIHIQPKANSISLSGISFVSTNEFISKKGQTKKFNYSLTPSTASDDVEVDVSNGRVDAKVNNVSKEITLEMVTSSIYSTTVTVRSKSKTSVSKSFTVYVYDYDASDVKVGDYIVYTAGTLMRLDCGLRHINGNTGYYVDASGKRSTVPITKEMANFVGVIAAPDLTVSLNCNYLSQCKNGASATGLYEYRNFTADGNLTGVGSCHPLVIKKDQSSSKVEWQHNNEFISISTATKDGLYQSQLHRYLALSSEDMTDGYSVIESGNTHVYPFTVYCKSGFVPHQLLKFYSNHVNNSNYKVIPVMDIEAYTDVVPKLSANKGTTGWFLPGAYEWEQISPNVAIINASLAAAGATTLSGNYWSTEERKEYQVYSYMVSGTTVNRILYYKDTRSHTDGSAYTRAVLYL